MAMDNSRSGFMTDFSTMSQRSAGESDADDEIILVAYGSEIRNRFRLFIAMPVMMLCVCILLNCHTAGSTLLLIISFLMLLAYYRYRICRRIQVSKVMVCEEVAGRKWQWKFNEIIAITELTVSRPGAEPGRRMILENDSSLDIAIDDQMKGYDEAATIIRGQWATMKNRKITSRNIGFFLLKYW